MRSGQKNIKVVLTVTIQKDSHKKRTVKVVKNVKNNFLCHKYYLNL